MLQLGQTSNVYKILIGKPEGKRSLGRTRRRWKDMDYTEIDWEVVDWIHLVQDTTSGGFLGTL